LSLIKAMDLCGYLTDCHLPQMGKYSWVNLTTWWLFLAPAAWKVERRDWGNWIPCGMHKWYN